MTLWILFHLAINMKCLDKAFLIIWISVGTLARSRNPLFDAFPCTKRVIELHYLHILAEFVKSTLFKISNFWNYFLN